MKFEVENFLKMKEKINHYLETVTAFQSTQKEEIEQFRINFFAHNCFSLANLIFSAPNLPFST